MNYSSTSFSGETLVCSEALWKTTYRYQVNRDLDLFLVWVSPHRTDETSLIGFSYLIEIHS